eukprot:m.163364 g.163364  ORF g.163364 m.163364 type:complete len:361 (+) comp12297_c0_seq1:652-1734(+)
MAVLSKMFRGTDPVLSNIVMMYTGASLLAISRTDIDLLTCFVETTRSGDRPNVIRMERTAKLQDLLTDDTQSAAVERLRTLAATAQDATPASFADFTATVNRIVRMSVAGAVPNPVVPAAGGATTSTQSDASAIFKGLTASDCINLNDLADVLKNQRLNLTSLTSQIDGKRRIKSIWVVVQKFDATDVSMSTHSAATARAAVVGACLGGSTRRDTNVSVDVNHEGSLTDSRTVAVKMIGLNITLRSPKHIGVVNFPERDRVPSVPAMSDELMALKLELENPDAVSDEFEPPRGLTPRLRWGGVHVYSDSLCACIVLFTTCTVLSVIVVLALLYSFIVVAFPDRMSHFMNSEHLAQLPHCQ